VASVHTCRAACALPIVGLGGVERGEDALALLQAGACAVGVGTALFREPRAARRILGELAALLDRHPLATSRAAEPSVWEAHMREPERSTRG
jgi:dihydroorotate dehydrogenase (NAD+) catalytic subunit